jgi:hypothetical protein
LIDLEGSRQRSEIVNSPRTSVGEFSPFVENSPTAILIGSLFSVFYFGCTVAH